MLAEFVALAVIGLIVLTAEALWRFKLLRREAGRKYVHILSAVWIASWPLIMSFRAILFLSGILLVGVIMTKALGISKSIHAIDRLTNGDILFPVGIGIASIFSSSAWMFGAALLHIGLADGLAGLLGYHYNFGRYKILGQRKTVLGTFIFMLASATILTGLYNYGVSGFDIDSLPRVLLVVPVLTAAAENLSPRGLDNISVPLATVLLLSWLA